MKRILLLAFVCSMFFFGCAGNQSVRIPGNSFIKSDNPTEIGRVYLENIYDLRYKESLYDLLSEETKMLIGFTGFSLKIEEILNSVDLTDTFKQVVVIDSFIFDQDSMVVYYIMFCEKELSGVYFVVELYFSKEYGNWKIDLVDNNKDFVAVPLIEQGSLGHLTRKQLTDLKSVISTRIDGFRKELLPEEAILYQEPEPDRIEKEIQHEAVVGKIYFETGNFNKARKAFERVLFLNPEHKEAGDFLQKTLNAIRMKEESLEKTLEKSRKISIPLKSDLHLRPIQNTPVRVEPVIEKEEPKSIEAKLYESCFDKGKVLYDAGEYRKAIVQFQKALNFNKSDEHAKNYINKCERAIQITR